MEGSASRQALQSRAMSSSLRRDDSQADIIPPAEFRGRVGRSR